MLVFKASAIGQFLFVFVIASSLKGANNIRVLIRITIRYWLFSEQALKQQGEYDTFCVYCVSSRTVGLHASSLILVGLWETGVFIKALFFVLSL